MDERHRLEPLGENHLKLRAAFCCGEDALDQYFRERARKEMGKGVTVVWVLYDGAEDKIAGYYTLSSVTILLTELPQQLARRLPKYPNLPATLLGRLAVDQDYKGQGLGGQLLFDALTRAYRVSSNVGSMAVVTDPKNEEAREFYEHYGFKPLATTGHPRLFLPMGTIAKLHEL